MKPGCCLCKVCWTEWDESLAFHHFTSAVARNSKSSQPIGRLCKGSGQAAQINREVTEGGQQESGTMCQDQCPLVAKGRELVVETQGDDLATSHRPSGLPHSSTHPTTSIPASPNPQASAPV